MKTPIVILVALLAAGAGVAAGSFLFDSESAEDAARFGSLKKELNEMQVRHGLLVAESEARGKRIVALEEAAQTEEARWLEKHAAQVSNPVDVADSPFKPTDLKAVAGTPIRRPTEAVARIKSVPGAEADPIATPEPPVTTPPRFFADAHHGSLANVDWKVVGIDVRQLTKLLPELVYWVNRSRPAPVDRKTSVSDLRRRLLLEVMKTGNDVPGAGISGKFTDPAFALNALAATLSNTKCPLSDEQSTRLTELAVRFLDLDKKRRAAYDENTFALEKLLDEARLKGQFFDECFLVLTEEQGQLLSPATVKDRIGLDLFSEASVLMSRVDVHIFRNQNSLAADVHSAIRRLMGRDGALVEQSRVTLARWAEGLPVDEIVAEQSTLDRAGMIPSDRAISWGCQVLVLLKSLVADLSMSEKRAKSIRALDTLSVPVR